MNFVYVVFLAAVFLGAVLAQVQEGTDTCYDETALNQTIEECVTNRTENGPPRCGPGGPGGPGRGPGGPGRGPGGPGRGPGGPGRGPPPHGPHGGHGHGHGGPGGRGPPPHRMFCTLDAKSGISSPCDTLDSQAIKDRLTPVLKADKKDTVLAAVDKCFSTDLKTYADCMDVELKEACGQGLPLPKPPPGFRGNGRFTTAATVE